VIGAGQPSPATIHSPVLPGGVIAKGAPLPPQTAVVVGAAHLPATVRLTCPANHRVADLLPPDARGVTAVYEPSTHPGISQTAEIALSGTASGPVGVAMLCRVPGPDGSLTPTSTARASTARPLVVACAEREYLRAAPNGGVLGSVSSGEPLRVLGRRPGWRRVTTQFGRTGWVPAHDLCG
jgi:Bacterial SH3 domain